MTYSPNSSGSPKNGILAGAKQFISPRENVKAVSVVENVENVGRSFWTLLKNTVATTVDMPLGIVEAGIALPNNILGLLSQFIDRQIAQRVNSTRYSINTLLSQRAGGSGK